MRPFKNYSIIFTAALFAITAFSQTTLAQHVPAPQGSYDRDLIETPGKTGERRIGSADAPVKVIEYISLTCGACASFHNNSYKQIKQDYIDTGKVEFITRYLIRNQIDAAVSTLSECSGDNSVAFNGKLLEDQRSWMQASSPLSALRDIAAEFGMDKEAFDSCLGKQDLIRGILAESDHASEEFNVSATPTFFVNGVKYQGVLRPTDFSTIVDPLL